jgi:site-specific DNA-methyltransferase (adenine-specific)
MNRVVFKSQTVEWPTPRDLYSALDAEFQFNFDPCPIDGTVDGTAPLFSEWAGKRVFCNPPYGPQIRSFLERASEAEVAVFLIPARTDTRWFHELVLPTAKEVRFVKGRLKFGDAKTGAPFPSMVVVFARNLGKSDEWLHCLGADDEIKEDVLRLLEDRG